jgi:hypothetical protein
MSGAVTNVVIRQKPGASCSWTSVFQHIDDTGGHATSSQQSTTTPFLSYAIKVSDKLLMQVYYQEVNVWTGLWVLLLRSSRLELQSRACNATICLSKIQMTE